MTTSIREWRNEEWETGSKARTQAELQRMARQIITNATETEDKPTPGSSGDLSRCLVCRSDLRPNTKYIIHINGFTVEDIIEAVQE